jgi:deoxyribodipyrimidine photolyase-related protein
VAEWYLGVYVDAFEWVELPNVVGMALFADGGQLASKPYAASGKYIDRMSNYCKGCTYTPKETLGPAACPFNALYWDFLERHPERLGKNPRLGMIYRSLEKMAPEKRAATRAKAAELLDTLELL